MCSKKGTELQTFWHILALTFPWEFIVSLIQMLISVFIYIMIGWCH
ncbi:hypothetical protein LINPERHAP1_LOCUS34832 [Linum perenne]